MNTFYPIGTAGVPWGPNEIAQWRASQVRSRTYEEEVLARIEPLREILDVEQYGELVYDEDGTFPLFAAKTRNWSADLPCVLITGGVHGYETSGVMGALLFAQRHAASFASRCNVLIAPCVSPWGFERIQRWNADALDPNRSFYLDSPSQEAAALMSLVSSVSGDFLMHIDLHETTDSDENEFRPALAARDGKPFEPGLIPDGFYTVGDTLNPQMEFQSAIISSVARVTHIAPADASGQIIGSDVVAEGVILYALRELGLCAGVTSARYTSTTEVYPDSPRATPEICNEAQVAAVLGGLEFALAAQ